MRTLSTGTFGPGSNPFVIDTPSATDGSEVNDLIANCQPLDENSVYCNLLQCTHFASTSAIAKANDGVYGFVSGYIVPEAPHRLFIWQVAVDEAARGHGLAKRMILDILSRPVCEDVTELHTTITPSNSASQALFSSVADSLDTKAESKLVFDRNRHLDGAHESEHLWIIGPFDNMAEELVKKAA
ncbi:diaminobutyrate acetyltransferase [Sneathiella limimaris]|uniref:diaminobutyrate acetyltransferase n=1 Tax=Sneathiella limimaris TaxID=1964213 RepID=UPI00146AFF6D|nr:diaminobutyrate acetyltransferase [Sneathiella limimaris]